MVQEYCLNNLRCRQTCSSEWIQYYDEIPEELDKHFLYTATGIDLAISERESADCTAMVSVKVYGNGDKMKVYILPHPVNERISFPKPTRKQSLYQKSWVTDTIPSFLLKCWISKV